MAKTVRQHPFQRDWRRDLIIAALASLVLAMTLLLYTFGLTSDFFWRLINAFAGIFILLAGTVFLIIPSVNWIFGRYFKKTGKTRTSSPAPKRNLPKAARNTRREG